MIGSCLEVSPPQCKIDVVALKNNQLLDILTIILFGTHLCATYAYGKSEWRPGYPGERRLAGCTFRERAARIETHRHVVRQRTHRVFESCMWLVYLSDESTVE